MSEELRLMKREDIPSVVSGELETLGDTLGEDFLQEEIENPFAYFYVMVVDHKVIGYIGAYIVQEAAEIINFFVLKEKQHQGYGQMLFNAILKQSTYHDVVNVTLEVKENNQNAINFYLKNGFRQVNIRYNYYDDGTNAIVMLKVIS
jgi:ribosomal-protein-alanine N-acetyltransferase